MRTNAIRAAFAFTIFSLLTLSCDDGGRGESKTAAPGAPMGVSASDGAFGNKVAVTWDEVTGAGEYRVYKSPDTADGEYQRVARGITGTEWEDAAVTVGRAYYYRVSAENDGGESVLSTEDGGHAGSGTPKPPVAPRNLAASDGAIGSVGLSWEAAEGAASYTVYRSGTRNGIYAELAAGITGTSYADSTVSAGSAYYYKLKAVNGDGASAFSNYDAGSALPYPPLAPAAFAATDGQYGNKVVLSWSSSEGAVSYTAYRADAPEGPFTALAENLAATGYTDYAAAVDAHYYYRVTAANAGGEGEACTADEGWAASTGAVLPEVPENIQASDGQTNQITLSWDAGANATSYKVYRADSAAGPFDETAVVATGVTDLTWVDATVTAGTTYHYRVRSVNDDGDSDLSDADSGRAVGSAPGVPVNVQATNGVNNKITVSWDAVTGAATYSISRSDSESGSYTEIAEGLTGTSWDDTTMSLGVAYYYKVSAVSIWGESALSAANGGMGIIATPTGLDATDGGNWIVNIQWTAVAGAESYVLQRKGYGSWGTIATLSGTVTNYSDTGLSLVNYTYRVYATAGTYTTPASNEDSEWGDL
ncbi:MAG: hypothetical protein EPN93_07610 [Spirochaetes bacterium]|nr:MAG: hypothetical protein EPN93_07610 [Spirochaetota bacterium]